MIDADARHTLVFALAHEVGNHLAGIRLEAHLLDEELGAHGLARSSVAIDSLAGRAGPLLALLRPLLVPSGMRASGSRYAVILAAVRRQLEEEGVGGRPVELEIAKQAETDGPAFEGLHALLLALVGEPATLPPGRAPIVLHLDRRAGESEVACELPGEAFTEIGVGSGEGAAPALRGRVLAIAIARVLVADAGGRVEVASASGRSRVVLRLPRG